MGKRNACPECGGFNVCAWLAGKWQCKTCRHVFYKHELVSTDYVPKNPRTTRSISDVQERRNARDVGGSRTIASGQTKVDKADVKISGTLRMECKSTGKASYGLKRADLDKLQTQTRDDEIPVFMIEFREEHRSPDEYAVVSKGWLLQLVEAYRNREDE